MSERASSNPPPLEADAHDARAAARLLELGHTAADERVFFRAALEAVLAATRGDYAALAAVAGGQWHVLGEAGPRQPLPISLLAEVLDSEQPRAAPGWLAAPLRRGDVAGELLVVHAAAERKSPATQGISDSSYAGRQRETATLDRLAALAAALGHSLAAVRNRAIQQRRIERLQTLLGIAAHWNQVREMEPLLVEMAEAATRLLGADRASIFLWDRPNRVLVGRPALGVPGGELRVPDSSGIVGQVLQSGEPRRVGLAREQEQINRQVDQQLGYQTRTLLCVPLRGRSGERFGVFEVINKLQGEFTAEDEAALMELAGHAAIALENTQERTSLLATQRQIADVAAQGVRLIGQSGAITELRSTISRVAATDLAVLILGENGTGKEVVSQSIHYLSPRRDQPFIAVNCAAISETLLESELFGHEKGAFTDAHTARQGKFELASHGTLFLDEIGDLSLGGQAKLLRVLEEKVVVRVGGSTPIHTDARVIAATNQNLAEMVRQKRFRQDLYFRLNVVSLVLPPLRERADDILLLAEHFLHDFCRKARRRPPELSAAARERLVAHTWPGNVRELRNMMERLAYLSTGDTITAHDLGLMHAAATAEAPTAIGANLPLAEATDEFQIEHIKRAIAAARGNMSEAAARLGLHRSNLYRKMKQLGMKVEEGG